ncbi:MAG TPA: ribonuclease E/G, partial [Rubricoccaceae bacterium]
MKKQIIINASQDRSRIAIVEDGELVELYVENPDNVRTIGNIYLGKVEKVMPTLRAAFVNIGEKQDAFLHFSDLTDNFPQLLAMAGEEVPGLEEPLLALAPQKRIADDESEPEVEDVLEVESGQDEAAEPVRSRSTRSR